MEQNAKKVLMISAVLAIQLLSSGCLLGSGGGGLFSFFGSGGSSAATVFSNSGPFGANDSQGSGGLVEELSRFSGVNPDGLPNDVPPVAVLHNPEPGSLFLFGSGLAGLGFLRRRRSRKASK